ncbi:hypothetical protein HYV70_02695 [Candidatus Uhrbacteria bacterium]|nr:hypothetical protein [Candidatus Uhrbacteria bacterium]
MKRSAFLFSFLFITNVVLTGVGCITSNSQDENPNSSSADMKTTLDTPFTLAPSQSIEVNTPENSELTMTFASVENDSRCPIGAQCVWTGEATVQLTISSAAMTEQSISLKTNNQPVEFNGYLITLIDLSPVPIMDAETDPNDYRATLSVSKR